MPRTAIASRVAVPQVQNLLTRSEELNHANWNVTSDLTVTADQAAAPDGTMTADLLTPTGGAGVRHYAGQGLTVPAAYQFVPRMIVASCHFRAIGAQRWVIIGNDRHTDFVYAWFDLIAGVVGSVTADNPTAISLVNRIENRGGGWFRCSLFYIMISPSGGAGTNAESIIVGPTTADGAQIFDPASGATCHAWGAQLVIGAKTQGPYVQTVAATVNTGSIRSLRSQL